jgi:hypothetical protein
MTTLKCPCGRTFEPRVTYNGVTVRCPSWPRCENRQISLRRAQESAEAVRQTNHERALRAWETRRLRVVR